MIDGDHGLSITKQAKALGISRGSVYYLHRPVLPADLAVVRRMDEMHLEFPFAGSRMLRDLLNREGVEIGRRHVATLMKRMRIEALYRKSNTSKPASGHKIYPYLLRGMTVDRPDQAWAMDITLRPDGSWLRLSGRRGRLVLAPGSGLAALHHHGGGLLRRSPRRGPSLRSPPRDASHPGPLALFARHGKPGIFNTDQGSQFTSHEFTGVLLKAGIAISMDGKGAWRATCSSSGSGARSNMRRFTSGPMTWSAKPEPRLAAI